MAASGHGGGREQAGRAGHDQGDRDDEQGVEGEHAVGDVVGLHREGAGLVQADPHHCRNAARDPGQQPLRVGDPGRAEDVPGQQDADRREEDHGHDLVRPVRHEEPGQAQRGLAAGEGRVGPAAGDAGTGAARPAGTPSPTPATTGDGARASGAASQVSTPRYASTMKMSAPQPSTTWAAAIRTAPRTSGPTHEARPERGPSSAPTPTSSANNGYVAYSLRVSTCAGAGRRARSGRRTSRPGRRRARRRPAGRAVRCGSRAPR